MNETLRTLSSNINIISLMVIIGLLVFSLSGCQQVNDLVNGNRTTNSNASANTNANANSNTISNVTANSNANANTSVLPTNSAANNQTSNTAANTATAPKEEVPLTQEAKVFKNTLVGKWKLLNYPNEVTFTEDKYEVKQGDIFLDTGSYRVLDEKTVEINSDQKNRKWNATMKVKDGGNRLDWEQQEPGETKQKIELERVNPK